MIRLVCSRRCLPQTGLEPHHGLEPHQALEPRLLALPRAAKTWRTSRLGAACLGALTSALALTLLLQPLQAAAQTSPDTNSTNNASNTSTAANANTPAPAALDAALLAQLSGDDSDAKIAAIQSLAQRAASANSNNATDSANALAVLQGLAAGSFTDAQGGEIVLNNRVRGELQRALAGLRLLDRNASVRLEAAREAALSPAADTAQTALLERALAQETELRVQEWLRVALARVQLSSPQAAQRRAAVETLAEQTSQELRSLLLPLTREQSEPDAGVRATAQLAVKRIDTRLALGQVLAQVFTGVSLGSILLLAALGLAITYGVMGVINMAHGELLMVGAYATYLVQNLFARYAPAWSNAYLIAAIPVAFVCAALVGALLERLVIRRLYGRPLETLLATWGLSLILIQAARTLFGAQNVEIANPAWMSGGFTLSTGWLAGVTLPWNRIAIIGFSAATLLLLWLLLARTRLGLFVRAVTQNRAMAASLGVVSSRVDTLAFALGAGIAGLGGLALSQIGNVGPDMGQSTIVDSFLVVVLGGVGQLAGAAWAALGLGVAAKFLEGWTGAVLAKIAVLGFVILFIQKRPQGLFALKGRFADH